VAAPPPAAAPAPVAHPAAWTPLDAAAGGGGIGSMGGSTSMPVPTDGGGFEVDDIGSLMSMAKLASKLAPGTYDPFGSQALWAKTVEDLPSVAESFMRNPANFLEAYTGGHLEAAFDLGGPAAQRAAFIASEFGAPGNVPSMLELTEISGGLGDAFVPGLEGIPQYTGADIAGFMDMGLGGPTHANTIANAIGGDPSMLSPEMAQSLGLHLEAGEGLIGSGYIDPWGTTPNVDWGGYGTWEVNPDSISNMFDASDAVYKLHSAPAAAAPAFSFAAPTGLVGANTGTLSSMLEGWGGLMSGAAPFLGAWAAAPITMGAMAALRRGNEKEQDMAKQREIARLEEAMRRVYTGVSDSPSAYADVVAGATESDRLALERMMAGGPNVPPGSEADIRRSMAQRQLVGLKNRDKLIEEGWLDSEEQLKVLGGWEGQALAAAGLADRAEHDRRLAQWQAMSAPLNQGGIASDEARRTIAQAHLDNEDIRKTIDLYATDTQRQSLGLERAQRMANPSGVAPSVPITQVPGLYRDAPQPSAQPSMVNLASFSDIPGMAGRSSGDLININPGFVDPAVQQAYAGYIGNTPGAGRSLLDALGANPQALARFQAALV